ncbi:MAG: DUF5132 domain-containing protein [Nitrospirae bacterium]|nr:DUF5132 domain-containing protein [Nitrospirota bacterium]MBF0541634.1 DUF5132 domain-containing protein [Nitrospirota bacterium]
MGFIEDIAGGKLLGGNLTGGLAIGVGLAIVGPALLGIISSAAKPVAKGAIKGGFLMYEKGQEAFEKGKEVLSEAIEVAEDIMAEAKAEMAEEKAVTEAVVPAVKTVRKGKGDVS